MYKLKNNENPQRIVFNALFTSGIVFFSIWVVFLKYPEAPYIAFVAGIAALIYHLMAWGVLPAELILPSEAQNRLKWKNRVAPATQKQGSSENMIAPDFEALPLAPEQANARVLPMPEPASQQPDQHSALSQTPCGCDILLFQEQIAKNVKCELRADPEFVEHTIAGVVEALGLESYKQAVEQELEKLREAMERPKGSALEIQQIRDVLLQIFPEDWQALGEKSLAREMMLNEHQAALLIGLSVRTLQNRRSSGDTPYYHKIGQRAVYRLGDVLDFVKEHRCKPYAE